MAQKEETIIQNKIMVELCQKGGVYESFRFNRKKI